MSASLVEQLQADAVQRSVPITDLLRRAKLVGTKLGRADLTAWVDHELTGYLDVPGAELPGYRQVKGEIKLRNPYYGWQSIGLNVEMPFAHPLGEIIGLIGNDSGYIMASVPPGFAEKVRNDLGVGVDIRFHAPCAALEAIVEGIRNAVLDWALNLEQAGVHGDGILFSPVETRRAQSVYINIGTIGNAVGLGAFGHHASISGTIQTDGAQLADQVIKLIAQIDQQLTATALPVSVQEAIPVALNELKESANVAMPEVSRLQAGLKSLYRILEGAAGNLMAAGTQALIVKILGGLHPPTPI